MKASQRLLYVDASAGVSGDMFLGSLVDLGVPIRVVRQELAKLGPLDFRLVRARVSRGGIRATHIRVVTPGDRGYRHFKDFERVVSRSGLDASLKDRALQIIERIFSAEAAIHGASVATVHLHELGSIDTLVDIVGTLVGIDYLKVDRIVASAVNLGGGTVQTEHGLMVVPAPATSRLLVGAEVFSDDSGFERTTPTGAVLLTGLADAFGGWPSMTLRQQGYGAGSKDAVSGVANVMRLALGETRVSTSEILVMETTIDDMSPELVTRLSERLFERGALDVFVTPVQMKKLRPGFNVTVLAHRRDQDALSAVVFEESSSIGVRFHVAQRQELERRLVTLRLLGHQVRVKEAIYAGRVVNAAPEYEDCVRVAKSRELPVKRVQQMAMAEYERPAKPSRRVRK